MKIHSILIIFILTFALFVGSASARNYYVSSSGLGNGLSVTSPSNPTTIDDIVKAGDTIYFLDDNYSGVNLVIQSSGNSSNPITLKAYNGTPTLDGLNKKGSGITITADYITVDGLNIRNYNVGINATGADYLTIQNCGIVNNYDGLYIDDCDFATIKDNSILGNVLLDYTQSFESGLGNWVEGHATGGGITYTGTGINNSVSNYGSRSYKFAAQGIEGSWPQAWITRSFNISSSSTYYVNVEGYTKADASDSRMTARATTSISSTAIPYISASSWVLTGYYGTDWEPGITDKTFASSVNTFYVMMGIYPSGTWSGYLDDVRVLVYGSDTHNGITVLNSSSPLIQDNIIQYLGKDGINLMGCVNPRVDRDTIKYVFNNGVNSTSTSSYTNVTNCTVFKTGNTGILATQEYMTAHNNTLSHTNVSAIASQIPNVESHGHSTITNNTIFVGQSYTGVSSASINTGMSSIVTNNRLNFGTTGVKADAMSVISNNVFGNLSQNSVDIEYRQYNLTIINNTFTSQKLINGAIGLRLKMLYNSVIRNNSFDNIGTAIGLLAYNSINSEKNIIENNTITGGIRGIVAENVVDNTITNNTFSGQSTNAIELQGPISTWSSFRNGVISTGLATGYILPSPFGIVAGIRDSGYITQGLTTLWTSNLTTPIKSTPVTYDNVLYVVTNGTLYAINNNDGSQIWKYSTGNIYPSTVSGIGNVLIHSSPAVNNSVIYFGSGNTLYAVNTLGSLVWRYQTGGQVISSPQVSGRNVYVGSTDGKLYAITESTGVLNWSYNLGDAIVSTPCIKTNIIGTQVGITAKGYNGSVAEVYDNGTASWTTKLSKTGGWSSPALGSYLYICTNKNETGYSSVYAYDVATGKVVWSKHDILGNITASPSINAGGAGHINVITNTGAAYLLVLTTGNSYYANKTYGSSGYIASPMGFSPGYVTVDSSGNIYRDYQYYTVSQIGYSWRSNVPTNISSSPIHSYGKLFVCGENGVVYALVPPCNVTISRNNISNTPCGVYSYSTEARVHNNTFSNVSQYINYTQMFAVTGTIENNNLIDSLDIAINKNSYVLAKNKNIPNITFVDSGSKFAIENNNIRLTTELSKAGKIARSIKHITWNQSHALWNDAGTDFIAKYTLTGLKTGTIYSIKRNGVELFQSRSDSTGKVQFTATGGSENTFAVEEITIGGVDDQVSPVDPPNYTTPVIIWSKPANISCGTALSSTQLNAIAIDPRTEKNATGVFTYVPAAGTLLSGGTHTLRVDFKPDDTANYTNVSREVTINVTSASPVILTSPVTDGLIVYYDGNLSGNTLVDLSGNENTGYARNVTKGTHPVTGAGYINLNGIDSRINVSDNAQTNISSPLTIEFIGSINDFKRFGALASKYSNGPVGWYLSTSSVHPYDKARFSAVMEKGPQQGYNSNISFVEGQVYDIVATYDNNILHIYVNGVESAGPRAWNSPTVGSPRNITIGSGHGLNYTNCSMYVFRLYNRALTKEEVLQNYNNDLWRYTSKAIPTL